MKHAEIVKKKKKKRNKNTYQVGVLHTPVLFAHGKVEAGRLSFRSRQGYIVRHCGSLHQ